MYQCPTVLAVLEGRVVRRPQTAPWCGHQTHKYMFVRRQGSRCNHRRSSSQPATCSGAVPMGKVGPLLMPRYKIRLFCIRGTRFGRSRS